MPRFSKSNFGSSAEFALGGASQINRQTLADVELHQPPNASQLSNPNYIDNERANPTDEPPGGFVIGVRTMREYTTPDTILTQRYAHLEFGHGGVRYSTDVDVDQIFALHATSVEVVGVYQSFAGAVEPPTVQLGAYVTEWVGGEYPGPKRTLQPLNIEPAAAGTWVVPPFAKLLDVHSDSGSPNTIQLLDGTGAVRSIRVQAVVEPLISIPEWCRAISIINGAASTAWITPVFYLCI